MSGIDFILLSTPLYAQLGPQILTAKKPQLAFTLVPKLLLENPVSKALALRDGKLELPALNSQAGAWELAETGAWELAER